MSITECLVWNVLPATLVSMNVTCQPPMSRVYRLCPVLSRVRCLCPAMSRVGRLCPVMSRIRRCCRCSAASRAFSLIMPMRCRRLALSPTAPHVQLLESLPNSANRETCNAAAHGNARTTVFQLKFQLRKK